jgi:hypothetical protein
VFDTTEEPFEVEKATKNGLSHIIGSKDEDVRFLPDLSQDSAQISKESRRNFSEREKWALIEEDGEAHNAMKIDVKGTHYENQSADEIAMLIMPLKGL